MASVKTLRGSKVGTADLDDAAFGGKQHPVILREAVLMYGANRRVGTAKVKTRAEVQGSTKKLYKQKHTGRARHGDKKAPLFRKGGVAHGPVPRDYRYALPRQALRKALKVALARKLADGEVVRWEAASFDKPSTKSAVASLASLGAEKSALLVGGGAVDRNVLLSVRNLPGVRALPAAEVTARDVVAHGTLVLLDGAYEALSERCARVGKGVKHLGGHRKAAEGKAAEEGSAS
jgi:large subunit ribosomal protein L4